MRGDMIRRVATRCDMSSVLCVVATCCAVLCCCCRWYLNSQGHSQNNISIGHTLPPACIPRPQSARHKKRVTQTDAT